MFFKLIPFLESNFWGGKKLNTLYNKKLDDKNISESYEFSLSETRLSSILVDSKELLLKDYLENNDLGLNLKGCDLKVLIKLIDSKEDLSLKVHPSDPHAKEYYNRIGKTEDWYILNALEGAHIYLGFNDNYTKEEVEKAIEEDRLVELLNKVEVKAGEFYKVPSGSIHGIGKGVTLYEIQEDSDISFRIYDFDRNDENRELKVKEALDCINYSKYELKKEQINEHLLTANNYYELYRYFVNGFYKFKNNGNSFAVITIITDDVKINNKPVMKGDSYYIEPDTEIEFSGKGLFLLSRVPDLAIGLDVGGTSIKGLIIDDLSNKVAETKVVTESHLGLDRLYENMAKAYYNLINQADIPHGFFRKIGVGCPGNIDSRTGLVLLSGNLNLRNAPISRGLSNLINMDVIIENDANCAALGEYYYTDKRKYHDMTLITLGTGVGSGFIIDSKLFKGGQGSTTELGHMKVKNDSVMCTCGQYGCFEALISLARIKSEVDKLRSNKETGLSELISDTDNPLKIFTLDDTNETAKKYAWRYQKNLLLGLVNVCNLFQPELIVIGGGVSYVVNKYFSKLEYLMNKNKFSGFDAPKVKLVHAKLGNDAGAYGACALTKV